MSMPRDLIKVWKDDYRIHSYEVDSKGSVTLPMLCQFMQESAWNHAQHLGVGFSHLIERKLLWVLSRQLITIGSFPKWGETIEIHTWPTGRDRLFCYRDFRLLNQENQPFGRATTAWFVIDLLNRRPQRTDSYFDIALEDSEQVFSRKLNKVERLNVQVPFESVHVGYRDLDINEHVNNVRYIEWILGSFPLEFQKDHWVEEIEINYLAEALYDDTIRVCNQKSNKVTFLHSLIRDKDARELCRAKTCWKTEYHDS